MTKTPDHTGGSLTQSLIRLGLRAAPERANAAKIFVTTLEKLERKAGLNLAGLSVSKRKGK
jgi:hypothetical protein